MFKKAKQQSFYQSWGHHVSSRLVSSRLVSGIIACMTSVAACGELVEYDDGKSSDAETSIEKESALTAVEAEFSHPLQTFRIDNKIPLLDVADFPDGSPIIVGHGILENPNGVVTQIEGVFAGTSRILDETERQQLADDAGKPRFREPRAARKMAYDVEAWISEASVFDRKSFRVRVQPPADYIPLRKRLEREFALGRITTLAQHESKRQELLATHQESVASVVIPLSNAAHTLGAEVEYSCSNMFCGRFRLTKFQLLQLAENPSVTRIDMVHPLVEDAVSGAEAIDGHQLFQYLDDNILFYNGDPSGIPVHIGVMEKTELLDSHVAFKDGGAGSSSRIKGMWNCDAGTCSSISSFGTVPGSAHGTWVTGIAAGDLMDGQDSSHSSITERRKRSGYGRESEIYYWDIDGDNDIDTALDHAISQGIQILNMSIRTTSGDPSCLGESALSQDLNDVFDAGILVFKSAGNANHQNGSDCTIGEPGSAVGAFVVGGHGSSWNTLAGEDDVRSGGIWTDNADGTGNGSSRGGAGSEGKQRTIIDMTAFVARQLMTHSDGGYLSNHAWGTSFSTPTVLGAAADYIEWYKETHSSAIDDPALLHTNMLLFGDREGSQYFSNYSNLWGAGRLKMRLPTTAGLDAPYGWGSYETCISDGESFTHMLNNGAKISYLVEPIKAVMFFYDRRHEDGTGMMDDIDLYLDQSSDGVNWTTVDSDTAANDEKARVYEDNVVSSSYYWRLRIVGFDVSSSGGECGGTNNLRVYYSFLFEDSARDDPDGPGSTVETE